MAPSAASLFDAWLEKNGITYTEAARRIGVKDSTVLRWASGARKPGIDDAIAIEKLTGGVIRAEDWPHLAALRSLRLRRV
jgi:DNA-binding transcriptional regulator YdaS (Cro superfamily)